MRDRQILGGAAANVYGQGVTVFTQLVGVPILIGRWGLHGFGLWTMLLTIPLFLIIMDFGYSAAAAAMMSRAVAHEDFDDALTSLHTALAIVGAIATGIFAIAVGLYFLVRPRPDTLQPVAGLSVDDLLTATQMAPFLIAYVGVSLLSGLINAVYRVNGLYTTGVMIFETGRLVEQGVVIGVASLGGGLVLGAIVMLCSRVTFTSLSGAVMLRQTPWVTVSLSHASRPRLAELTKPAIAAMFIPICIITGMQGITVAVGLCLTPAVAGAFATVRVIYRMVVQIVGTLTRACVPDFAIAYSRGDIDAQVRIADITLLALFVGATVGTVGILIFGPRFVASWTGHAVAIPFYIYVILAAHSFFGCIWNGLSNLLAGLNLHPRYVFLLLVWNVGSVALLLLAIETYGLAAAAIALAAIDVMSFASVWRVWHGVSPRRMRGQRMQKTQQVRVQ